MAKVFLGATTDPNGYDSSGITAGMNTETNTNVADTTASSSTNLPSTPDVNPDPNAPSLPTETPENAPQIIEPSSGNSTLLYLGFGLLLFLAFKKKLLK